MHRYFGEKTTAQSTSDLMPKFQTSEISLKTSDLMLKHQKWQGQDWMGCYGGGHWQCCHSVITEKY